MTFVVPPNTTVDAGDYLVLGQTTVGANNGDAPVDLPYGNSLTLAGADTVSVKVLGSLLPDAGAASPFLLNAYSWTSSTTGASSQRDPPSAAVCRRARAPRRSAARARSAPRRRRTRPASRTP
ncbi:MAG: hypothetical protein IPJ65_00530 [Archangiaceae bacterium]|nr:hypothetical protein [Archangiaceae bacterium]